MDAPTPSTNCECDFTGFTVPSTTGVAWGTPGAIVYLQIIVDIEAAVSRYGRQLYEGVWDRDNHALLFTSAKKKPATIGLYGLVRLTLERKNAPGFTVHGRALAEDEARLRGQMLNVAEAEMDRLIRILTHLQANIREVGKEWRAS